MIMTDLKILTLTQVKDKLARDKEALRKHCQACHRCNTSTVPVLDMCNDGLDIRVTLFILVSEIARRELRQCEWYIELF